MKFQSELTALVKDMRDCGSAFRADGVTRSNGKDTPATTPHYVFALPREVASAIKLRIQALDAIAAQITTQAGLSARPRALAMPKYFENVERAVLSEKVEHESKIRRREEAIHILKNALDLQGDIGGLAEAVAELEHDPCPRWTVRKNTPSVGIRANIWLDDGRCVKDVYCHRNGLILFGDSVEVELPSTRKRRPRSDRLGEPDIWCGAFSLYRQDGQKKKSQDVGRPVRPVHQIIEHFDQNGGADDAWL